MKLALVFTLLGILVAILFLSVWSRKRVSEGFQNAPDCVYSDVIPGKFLLGCANDPNQPFLCQPYRTLEEAKAACTINPVCRGIVKNESPVGPEGDIYTIRTGGIGATDYNNLETLKRDLLGNNPNESAYLITNLNQCKPNTRASTVTTEDKTVGARYRQSMGPPPGTVPDMPPGGVPSMGPGGVPSMGPGGQMPSFQMSEGTVTVPAGTLISVPAGDTIYARRGPGQGIMESQPECVAPPPDAFRVPSGPNQRLPVALTVNDFTVEEATSVARLPTALQLKVINTVRQGLRLRDVLTADELDLLALANTGPPPSSVEGALASTPSNVLTTPASDNLTTADLAAISQAAAQGVAQAIA